MSTVLSLLRAPLVAGGRRGGGGGVVNAVPIPAASGSISTALVETNTGQVVAPQTQSSTFIIPMVRRIMLSVVFWV
jgi:hypothetical protein